jgi:hypothetical protein
LEPEIIGIPEACRTDLKNAKLGKLFKHGKLFDNNDKSNMEPNIIGIPETCRSYLKNVKLGELLKHVSHAGRMQKLTHINYIQIFICSGQWVICQ